MPYSKRSYNSYKRYRKNTNRNPRRSGSYAWKRAGARAGSLAYKAYKTANFVRSIVNTEYKYSDVNMTLNATPVIQWVPLNAMAQGDDNNQRNGRSVLLKSIQYRLSIGLGGSQKNAIVRIVILRHNSCNGQNPVNAEVYTNPNDINSWRNLVTVVPNYTIIMDKRYSLDVDYKDRINIEKYMKMQDHIKFVGANATLASCGPGSYFLGYWTDVTTDGTTASVNVTGNSRIRYIDN